MRTVYSVDSRRGFYQNSGACRAVYPAVFIYNDGVTFAGPKTGRAQCRTIRAFGTRGTARLCRRRRSLVSSKTQLWLYHWIYRGKLCNRQNSPGDPCKFRTAPYGKLLGACHRIRNRHGVLLHNQQLFHQCSH